MKTMILLLKVLRRQFFFTLNFKEKIIKEEIEHKKKIFFLSVPFNKVSIDFKSVKNYIYFFYDKKNVNSINPIPGQNQYLTNVFNIPKSNATFYLFDNKTKNLALSISNNIHYVAIPFFLGIKNISLILRIIANKQIYISRVSKIGNKKYFILESKEKQINKQTRRYVPYLYSRKSFMQQLLKLNINAVMLRWFDKIDFLGDIKEDIDVLVADDFIDSIDSVLESKVGVLPIDLYSVSGEENTDYAGLLYYPKILSDAILASKSISNGFYVPNSYYFLMSIVYHAVFHKGSASALALNDREQNLSLVDHNYSILIRDLLHENGLKIPVNLLDLSLFLKGQGYYPSYDSIVKLKYLRNNDIWFETLINLERQNINLKYKPIEGLSVLLIREAGSKLKISKQIEDNIKSFGFYIIKSEEIPKDKNQRIIDQIRGGNWSKGPFEKSGGYPRQYYIIFDPFFVMPDSDLINKYPSLENKKIHILKSKLRKLFNFVSAKNSFNGVHSSDDFYESINYLEILGLSEEKISEVLKTCDKINIFYKSDEKVISNLSKHSSRAKIELIEFKGRLAIKKTFNKYSSRFLHREINFMKKFKNYTFVPKLYVKGDNYFITEYFDNSIPLSDIDNKLSKDIIKQLYNIFKILHAKNYCVVDLNPTNVLFVNNQLKIIDFEFAIQIEQPINLIDSYDLNKLPIDAELDLPKGYQHTDLYTLYWEPLTGMKKKRFIEVGSRKN